MPFINEFIPESDIEKYGIREINRRYRCVDLDWTVDRERDIYLRRVGMGREEARSQTTWTLYWRGHLIELTLIALDAGGKRGGSVWSHEKLEQIRIPAEVADKRDAILDDLRDALTAYKDGGVYASATSYTLKLDI